MSLRSDARDLGELLDYALRPKTRPGAEGEYARLMNRYQSETDFREAFDGLLDGMHLRVLHPGDLGMVITARRESVFAYKLSGEVGARDRVSRAVRGLAHLGIAAYAYPHPDDLHDPAVRYIDVLAVEDFIRRSCTQLRARADAVAMGDVDDRIIDLALAAGLDTAWSEWETLPAVEVSTRGRGTNRIKSNTAAYWVLRACNDLVEYGLARPIGGKGDDTDRKYQLLDRFRHHVAASAAQEGYQALATLARTDGELPDQHDLDRIPPLPAKVPQFAEVRVGSAGTPARADVLNGLGEAASHPDEGAD